ncbi:MAG TPA: ATP-binding protein [Micromonosporaceae bacterium]
MSALLSTAVSGSRAWRRGRRMVAFGVAVAGLTCLTVALALRHGAAGLTLTTVALLYLIPVAVVALLGGVWLGLGTAVASDALLNFYFVPPYHTFTVERGDNIVALLVYVLVAVTVSVAVELAAHQRARAVRSGIEAQLLTRIAAQPVAERSPTQLLDQVREAFGMRLVALLETGPDGRERVVERVGEGVPTDTPSLSVPAADGMRLVADGPKLIGEDRRLLGRLAVAAAHTVQARREAARAAELAEVDRLRTQILAAVGHDLRTPLAGIKAAVSSLRDPEVAFSPGDRDDLLATVEESADRLDDLVANLLALSRLQAGVLSVQSRPVPLDEVVARALLAVPDATGVQVAVDDALPLVEADPGLLERVVANLVGNATRANAGQREPVTLHADTEADLVRLRVIDHGAGVPAAERERMFEPFQRLGDRRADGGLGLGLAIARGFTEAMGGTVTATDTTGGGLTMTVTLPAAAVASDASAARG